LKNELADAQEHRTARKATAGNTGRNKNKSKALKLKRKSTMPLNAEQLAKSREILLEKRAHLARQVERLAKDAAESTEATENSKSPISSAENASDAFEQDFAFMSMESEEELLRKVDQALKSIREKTYGMCEECGEEIKAERLEALPWATMCVQCQAKEERGELRRRRQDLDFDVEDDNEEALIGDDKDRA
jgi:DnaK suppressor protein